MPRRLSDVSPPPDFWERWPVRLLAVLMILGAVVIIANVGDPAAASWDAKTWELLHDMAATSVGRR